MTDSLISVKGPSITCEELVHQRRLRRWCSMTVSKGRVLMLNILKHLSEIRHWCFVIICIFRDYAHNVFRCSFPNPRECPLQSYTFINLDTTVHPGTTSLSCRLHVCTFMEPVWWWTVCDLADGSVLQPLDTRYSHEITSVLTPGTMCSTEKACPFSLFFRSFFFYTSLCVSIRSKK